MPSFSHFLPLLALSVFSAGALVHCSSAARTVDPPGDAGPDALPDAAADVSPDHTDDAEASVPEAAPPPCSVRTSDADAGVIDPTFQPFTWTLPASDYTASSYPPKVAVAPGGDAYVAVAVGGPEGDAGSVNESLYVVVMHVQASGDADPSFGTGGLVTLPSWTGLYDLIVDHNGDAVVTGVSPTAANTPGGGFTIVALRPDGSTDFTIDGISANYDCAGCIADGADGYLALGPQGMVNIPRNGLYVVTDQLPVVTHLFSTCRMRQDAAALYLHCGDGGGGEVVRYDLHGVLDPSFGSGGAAATPWDPVFDPWIAPDGSLFLTAADEPGPNFLEHFLSNGTVDPAYPTSTSVEPAFPVFYAAPRCDGTELFVESGPAGPVMETMGPSGPPLKGAGAVTARLLPDGGTYWSDSYAIDSHGAVLALYSTGLSGIELVRVLPSN
jgi:hypothetical protein